MGVVVAARDIEYCGYHTPCGPGSRTDTIFYVRLRGGEARALALSLIHISEPTRRS